MYPQPEFSSSRPGLPGKGPALLQKTGQKVRFQGSISLVDVSEEETRARTSGLRAMLVHPEERHSVSVTNPQGKGVVTDTGCAQIRPGCHVLLEGL